MAKENDGTRASGTGGPPNTPGDLRDIVDQRVDYHLERIAAFLKVTLGWTSAILAAAVAVAVFSVTFFGFKSASDIDQRIEKLEERTKRNLADLESSTRVSLARLDEDVHKAVKEGVEQRLNNAKPEPVQYYQERVDKLYDRALISSLLIEATRAKARGGEGTSFGDAEFERVARLLTAPDTDLNLFGDCLTIIETLDPALRSPRDATLRDVVKGLRTGKVGGVRAPDKLKVFLESKRRLDNPEITPEVRVLLNSRNVPDELVVAAIDYLKREHDYGAAHALESLSNESNPRIRRASLVALASIDPSSPAFVKWIEQRLDEFAKGVPASERSTVFQVMSNLARPRRAEDDVVATTGLKRSQLAEKLLDLLLALHPRFEYDRFNADAVPGEGLNVAFVDERSMRITVNGGILTDNREDGLLARKASRLARTQKMDELNSFLESICIFRRSPREQPSIDEPFETGFELVLEKGAAIRTNEATIDAPQISGTPTLVPRVGKASPMLLWRDSTGVVRQSAVNQFVRPESIRWAVRVLHPADVQNATFDWESDY